MANINYVNQCLSHNLNVSWNVVHMNNSGSGNIKISVSLTWTSDNVSHVLFNGQCVVAEHIEVCKVMHG